MSCCFQHTYSKEDCTFREQILPDGYNIYVSVRHGALLSLGNHRQRLEGRDRGVPALAQFLPRISTLDQTLYPGLNVPEHQGQPTAHTEEPVDSMDSFGKLSQIIHSPSFHKRWDTRCDKSEPGCFLGITGPRPEVALENQPVASLQPPPITVPSDIKHRVQRSRGRHQYVWSWFCEQYVH